MDSKISVPLDGEKISINSNLKLDVPNNPIIHIYVEMVLEVI